MANTKNYKKKSAKTTRSQGRLLSPDLTPAVEEARIAAENARRNAANAQAEKKATTDSTEQEIKRILNCAEDSYAETLAVDPASSEDDTLVAWVHLGCMLHPTYCKTENAEASFKSMSGLQHCSTFPTRSANMNYRT